MNVPRVAHRSSPVWPVSVKGVLGWGGRYVVLWNERDEWELPGGRLEPEDSNPESALRREIGEELGLEVDVGPLVDSWIYDVAGRRVLILTYRCALDAEPETLHHSDEHRAVARLTLDELESASVPPGYVRSIRRSRQL